MLEKLGEGLKEAIRKITKAGYIDKQTVSELVNDIQRSLMASDVNIKLAFDLTNKIKDRALNEKPAQGITPKEHIVKIVYEELVKFVGKKPEILVKPHKIMLVGLFGSGKCVHKDSKIAISDGKIVSAEELYNRYKEKEEKIRDGKVIDMEEENIFVPSFNPKTLKIENKRVTNIWKLEGKELLQVYLDNGNDFSVRVTPEHPFFALRNGRVEKVRADQLTGDDFVAVPTNYEIMGEKQCLIQGIRNLDLEVKGHELDLSKIDIKNEILPKLKYPKNYCKLTTKLKRRIAPICLIDNFNKEHLLLKSNGSKRFVSFNLYLTEELAEFLGYLMGDGHLENGYVEISNENQEVINRIKYLSDKLFNLKVDSKRDKRTKSMYSLRIVSTTLVEIINKVFWVPIGKKGKKLRIPEQILKSDKNIIKSFLRAYFDCDASAVKNVREIELSSESHQLIVEMAYLLNRFGIISSISKKYVNDIPYWRLFIRSRYAEIYAEKIGFSIKHKKDRIEKYYLIGKIQGCGKQDMLPLGASLRELRQSLGFSIGEIQEYVNSYGTYEMRGKISTESLEKVVALYLIKNRGNIALILDYINSPTKRKFTNSFVNGFITILKSENLIKEESGQILLTERAVNYLRCIGNRHDLLDIFKTLTSSDVSWLRVNKIENIGHEEFVYDLTVEDNHSFIADNIIVHNTTSIGKIAKFYQKKGLKPALIGCDVHRPAAMDQLSQIASQLNIPCYAPKDLKNTSEIASKGLEQFSKKYDVIIVDAAGRNALDKELAKELKELGGIVKPEEVLLTIPADLGQAAGTQASEFKKLVGITGIFLTKMDGTARGGGALTACSVTEAPVKFIGNGEKMDAIEIFDPERFISKLIGFGDLQSLLEKAKEVEFKPETAKKIMEGQFTLKEFYEQIKSMQKMGSLKSVMDMIPGVPMQLPKEFDMSKQEEKMKKWAYIIDSMTPQERENPGIIEASRIKRIAKGSGTEEADVRDLIKQFDQAKKVMKMVGGAGMKRGPLAKLAKRFKGMM